MILLIDMESTKQSELLKNISAIACASSTRWGQCWLVTEDTELHTVSMFFGLRVDRGKNGNFYECA